MKLNKRSSEQIKSSLIRATKKIEPSEDLFEKIKSDIYKKECEETMKIKANSFKKGRRLTTLVASLMLVCSVSVLGVTMIKGNTWIGHSNHKYKNFPSQEKVLKDVGFSPKYTKSLPGGFEYVSGGIGESKLSDERGEVLTKTKDINLGYKRENEKSILNLSVSQMEEEFLDNKESELVGELNGIDLYYYQKDYKFVPADYELTEEDKKSQENGDIVISYGAPEEKLSNVQGLHWYEDGLEYILMGNDYNFTVEEMIDMASTIVEQ